MKALGCSWTLRSAVISLACATTWMLIGGDARAEGSGDAPLLPPLPPVELGSGDLVDDADDADDAGDALDLENVKGPPAGRSRGRRARPRRQARIPRPPFTARPPRVPHVFVLPLPRPPYRPRAAPVRRPHVLVLRDPVPFVRADAATSRPLPSPERDEPSAKERDRSDDGRAHGGLLVTGGGTRYFGVVPEGALMPGARLHVATPLPTLPGGTSSSRWLSSGTVGLTGGFDAGTNGGVDAQLWRAGLVLAMGAPWTRDFIGVALEGGVLGGHYWDGNDVAYSQGRRQAVQGPHGEGIAPKPYGLARLTLQIPLRNDVRPFVAGDLGMTERTGDRLAGIAGIHAGVVWNAW